MALITQNRVEIAGAIVAAVGGYFLHGYRFYSVLACVAVYFLARLVPEAFAFLPKNFNRPQWPMLVACGVGIVFFAAPHGGISAAVTCAGFVAAIDGDFWPY